jgi:hypothetical protein
MTAINHISTSTPHSPAPKPPHAEAAGKIPHGANPPPKETKSDSLDGKGVNVTA